MIPCIQDRGHSFMGITAYLMHDKDAKTSERVAWTQTGNMRTSDIGKAAKVMAWTDAHREGIRAGYRAERDVKPSAAGRKASAGNVLHQCLAWALGEKPSEDHQRETVQDYLKAQGLDRHQYYAVAHNDTEHIHVHIVSNLVHPETGNIHELSFAKRNAQKWALGYERKHGLHCQIREENAARHAQGKSTKYRDEKQDYATRVTRAYHASDSGRAFVQSLKEEGLTLCAARRGGGFVIVDERGGIQKLARQLDIDEKGKAKTAAINKKLGDLDRAKLADADALAAQRKAAFEHQSQEREAEKEAHLTQAKQEKPALVARKPKLPPEPVYKRVDRDRDRAQEDSKRRTEIENSKAYYDVDAHRAKLKEAERMVADCSDWLSRLLGDTCRAEDHARAMRLNLEDAIEKQQQAIDAINRKYHHGPEPEPPRKDAKPEAPRQQAKPELREDFSRTQTASQPLPDLGKMRAADEIQRAVKKQGWQDPGADDPFSGLKPEFQGKAREAYRQAKAAELKGKKEQESLRQKGPRLDRD